ncbi:uncharacterized protein LOC143028412 [Oratosquilla oratoria]|uniref:uncharacterized protein LOC143028412 n=1 Tax=Oratosquilla oratoria TaxID=337810 RepID=UPI003F770730
MDRRLLIVVSLFHWVTVSSRSVRITELGVPKVAIAGDDVNLRCDYQEEGGARLYTLKWYKNKREFFRYVPGNSLSLAEGCLNFKDLPDIGVEVDCFVSSDRDVLLSRVTEAASGDYMCEVISDHPDFSKMYKESKLTVYNERVLPPTIHGALPRYRSNDIVALNCTSENVEYTPVLTWTINGQVAPQDYIRPYENRQLISIVFSADSDFFQRGELAASCTSSLGPDHKETTTKHLYTHDFLQAQQYHFNAASTSEQRLLLLLLLPLAQIVMTLLAAATTWPSFVVLRS